MEKARHIALVSILAIRLDTWRCFQIGHLDLSLALPHCLGFNWLWFYLALYLIGLIYHGFGYLGWFWFNLILLWFGFDWFWFKLALYLE